MTRLQQEMGYSFKAITLLEEALVHGSIEGRDEDIGHARRLSWLGDAVLDMIVSDYLVEKYPKVSKEWLHNSRQKLTRNTTLGRIGSLLKIEEAVITGASLKGILGTKERHKMLPGLVEGVVGAIFLEGGIRKARKVVIRILRKELRELRDLSLP